MSLIPNSHWGNFNTQLSHLLSKIFSFFDVFFMIFILFLFVPQKDASYKKKSTKIINRCNNLHTWLAGNAACLLLLLWQTHRHKNKKTGCKVLLGNKFYHHVHGSGSWTTFTSLLLCSQRWVCRFCCFFLRWEYPEFDLFYTLTIFFKIKLRCKINFVSKKLGFFNF